MYHVAIGFKGEPLPPKAIQDALGAAGWARYAPNCWLVSSSIETPNSICQKLRDICSKEDTIFVVEIDPSNYQGYLLRDTWDWFNEHS